MRHYFGNWRNLFNTDAAHAIAPCSRRGPKTKKPISGEMGFDKSFNLMAARNPYRRAGQRCRDPRWSESSTAERKAQ